MTTLKLPVQADFQAVRDVTNAAIIDAQHHEKGRRFSECACCRVVFCIGESYFTHWQVWIEEAGHDASHGWLRRFIETYLRNKGYEADVVTEW